MKTDIVATKKRNTEIQNMLFIWYRAPHTIPNGGDHCSIRNYQLCCDIVGKENIHSIYIHHKKQLTNMILAPVLFSKGYYYGLTPARVKSIIRLAQDYDCVFIDRSLFGVIAYKLKKSGYSGKVITHFHNVEKTYMNSAKLPKWFPFRNIIINCADRNDQWAMQWSDKTIALNSRDEEELFHLYGKHADLLIPIALPDTFSPVSDSAIIPNKPCCITIGSYFAPNNEGIIWFIQNVLPHVNITYKIIGKNMHKLKEEHSELLNDVEVISNAPSLVPYFQEADIMILPIFSGSGMKVKTCESLMYGKNILGTSEAFEGYQGEYSLIGGKCDTAEQFINCIQNLTNGKQTRFNKYSRELFLECYSYEAVKGKFRQLILP